MKPRTGRRHDTGLPIPRRLLFACLCLAGCAASPVAAWAQGTAPEAEKDAGESVAAVRTYACVDPSDALARRRLQSEPCRLPMYELPRPDAPRPEEQPRRPAESPDDEAARNPGHAMFWRFPVQGHGPHEVPRHTWR